MYLTALNTYQLPARFGNFCGGSFYNRFGHLLNSGCIINDSAADGFQRSTAENTELAVSEFFSALRAFSGRFGIALNGLYSEKLTEFAPAVNAEFAAFACFTAFITYKHISSIPDSCI